MLLAGIGAGNTVVDVAAITLLQRAAPAHVIGRVFGVLESIMLAAIGDRLDRRAGADRAASASAPRSSSPG